MAILLLIPLLSAFLLSFLLLPAGRWDWPEAYLTILLLVSGWVGAAARLRRLNPALLQRRSGILAGTPAWDKVLVRWLQGGFLLILLLAGLESRARLPLPHPGLQILGLGLYLGGLSLYTAAQAHNPFFEGMVRHQMECGHRLVDQGPYTRLRHPGYLGFLLAFGSLPLLLGSSWAWAGWTLVALTMLLRLHWEEAFLRQHLPDYSRYCTRVKWRLLPFIW